MVLPRQELFFKSAGFPWLNSFLAYINAAIFPGPLKEIRSGNPEMAAKRLALIHDLKALAMTETALNLAQSLISGGPLPQKAADDAIHIALAAVNEMDYLLSWNCKHITNLFIQKDLAKILARQGFRLPTIGTPESFLGE